MKPVINTCVVTQLNANKNLGENTNGKCLKTPK